MKLASLRVGIEGRLIVASRDLKRATDADLERGRLETGANR